MGNDTGRDEGAEAAGFLRYFARLVAAEIRGADVSLVSQATSPLGARLHNAAVRRRMAEHARGELPISGASKVGKRYFLTQEALAEELGRDKGPGVAKAKRAPKDDESGDEQAAYDTLMARYRGPKQ